MATIDSRVGRSARTFKRWFFSVRIDKNKIFMGAMIGISMMAVGLIVVKILKMGFIPYDDALRYAANAVSGKNLEQIIVLHDDIKLDPHLGWNYVLRIVHILFYLQPHALVLFSVSLLFFLFSSVPLLLLKRPEAWISALLVVNILTPAYFNRLLFGRPFIFLMTMIVVIGCLAKTLQKRKNPYPIVASLTLLIALSVWLHYGWYFFILPALSFFMARQWRTGFFVSSAIFLGVVLGALFTGHPIIFFIQPIKHVFGAFAQNQVAWQLVPEIRPFGGDVKLGIVIVLMLLWRFMRRDPNRRAIKDPVVCLVLTCWVLSIFTARVWLDIGMAAMLLWMAEEFQEVFLKIFEDVSLKRFFCVGILSVLLFFLATNNTRHHWSEHKLRYDLTFNTPDKTFWAPASGGIVYNNSMRIFFHMFYENPKASWRYMVGPEPGIMPSKDLKVFRNLQTNLESSSFVPWVKRMRVKDRLIVLSQDGFKPDIEGLEWFRVNDFIWVGRCKAGSLYKNLQLSDSYNSSGQYQKTIQLLDKAVKEDPNNASYCFLNLAIAYAEIGKGEQAIELLEESIKNDQNVAQAYYSLGLIYKNKGDSAKAVDFFGKSIQQDVCFAPGYYGLAVIYHDQCIFKKAISYYRKAALLDPKNAFLYNDLATAYFSLYKYTAAIKCSKKAIEINPEFGLAYYNLAVFYYSINRYDQAIRFCDKAVALKVLVSQELQDALKPYRK